MDRIAEQKFNEIQFTPAEREIIRLMKAGKNFNQITEISEKEKSTLFKQLNVIYNKTKNIVSYGSKVRRFLTLQNFLSDPEATGDKVKFIEPKAQKTKPRFTFDDEDKTDELNEIKKQLQMIMKENDELRSKIKKLENTPPRLDFDDIKNKIKTEIEKLSQKLRMIEELEEMMEG